MPDGPLLLPRTLKSKITSDGEGTAWEQGQEAHGLAVKRSGVQAWLCSVSCVTVGLVVLPGVLEPYVCDIKAEIISPSPFMVLEISLS